MDEPKLLYIVFHRMKSMVIDTTCINDGTVFNSIPITKYAELKRICQDFENFVNVLWIRSLIYVDLICERNFEIGFIVFEHLSFDFSAQIFL